MTLKQKVIGATLIVMLAGSPVLSQASYKVLPASNIQISGTSTLSDWVVKSDQVSGEMILATGSKAIIKSAHAALEVSSIKSEKGEAMDNKMYNALKHDSHPTIKFKLTKPLELAESVSRFSAAGNVELAGVTKPMTFDLEFTRAGDTLRFQGKRSLKLSDFDIEPPTAMFGQIETGDEIVVAVDLVFGN
jgi:polyisoprenoid-binding protein YceI